MTTTALPYKTLKLNGADFANPRIVVESNSIVQLAESIHEKGLMYPLQVWKAKDEKGKEVNVVVDGGRRLRAIAHLVAKKKNWNSETLVDVRVVEAKNLQEARILALTGNIQRVELRSFEVAKEMVALKESGLTGKQIAKRIGKSQAWVSKQLSAYNKCSDAVRHEWKSGRLPDDDVFNLSKLEEEEQDKRLDKVMQHRAKSPAANGKPSAKDRGKARKAAKGKKSTKRPTPAIIEQFVTIAEKAPKSDRYIAGMKDALRFAAGLSGPGSFGKEWTDFAKKQAFASKTDAKPAKK